jgi:MOSC domain-containing protein YiiM
MITQCTVIKLTRYAAKGEPGEAVESALFLEGLGMKGDFHAKGGDRQLSLLSRQDQQWMEAQAEQGLCFSRYRENILLNLPNLLEPSARLQVGGAVLEITETIKQCFEQCPLFSRGQTCILAGRNLFAKVVKGGIVQTGDNVTRIAP